MLESGFRFMTGKVKNEIVYFRYACATILSFLIYFIQGLERRNNNKDNEKETLLKMMSELYLVQLLRQSFHG